MNVELAHDYGAAHLVVQLTIGLSTDINLAHRVRVYAALDDLVKAVENAASDPPRIIIRVERKAVHTYVKVWASERGGDPFGLAGQLCLRHAEADFLISNIRNGDGVEVKFVARPDTTVSGYSAGDWLAASYSGTLPAATTRRVNAGELDDRFCYVCWRDASECYCRDNQIDQLNDPELRAVEREATEDLLGYDPLDAVVGFERLVAQ